MRPETLYLADIIEAAEAIAEFVQGLDELAFTQDAKTQSAVIQKLIVIGEAAARLPQDFKDRYPQIECVMSLLSATFWCTPISP